MYGIDVSHHQGTILWQPLKLNKPNIEFIYIKATEGVGYIDPLLKNNALKAKSNGFKIGYYHFASLNDINEEYDAKKEANFFLDTISKLPKNDLPLVLDLEENKIKLSPEEVYMFIKTFFKTLEERGFKDYVLYSYTPFLNANLPQKHDLNIIKLWLASYTKEPVLPRTWTRYWLWQYSDKGKIKGINGNVDLNKS